MSAEETLVTYTISRPPTSSCQWGDTLAARLHLLDAATWKHHFHLQPGGAAAVSRRVANIGVTVYLPLSGWWSWRRDD